MRPGIFALRPILVAAAPALLWYADFTSSSVGSIPTPTLNGNNGLFLVRNSPATVQTSAETLVSGIGANVARVGQRTNSSSTRGLVIEESRDTQFVQSHNLTGSGLVAGSTFTFTTGTIGPDGNATAGRMQVSSSGYSTYYLGTIVGSNGNAGYTVASFWHKQSGVSTGSIQATHYAASTGYLMAGVASSSWARIISSPRYSAGGQPALIPADGRAFAAGSTIKALDYAGDWYQLEYSRFATEVIEATGSVANRAGERLYTNASNIFTASQLNLEFTVIPKGASVDYNHNPRILTVNSGTYVEYLSASQRLNVSVAGVTSSIPTAFSWSQYDEVNIRLKAGYGFPRAEYRQNGGAPVNLGTGSVYQGWFSSTGTVDLFCSGSGSQFTSWVRSVKTYPSTEVSFALSNISGHVVDLNPAFGISQSSGRVFSWTDQVSNAVFFQSASAQQPFYNATDTRFKNQPSVQFSQSFSTILTGSSNVKNLFPSGATIFVVTSVSESAPLGGDLQYCIYGTHVSSEVDDFWHYIDGRGYMGTFRSARVESYPQHPTVTLSGSATTSGSHCLMVRSDANGFEFQRNGNSPFTQGIQAGAYSSGSIHHIGGKFGAINRFFEGRIARILMWNRFLNDGESQAIRLYLNYLYNTNVDYTF